MNFGPNYFVKLIFTMSSILIVISNWTSNASIQSEPRQNLWNHDSRYPAVVQAGADAIGFGIFPQVHVMSALNKANFGNWFSTLYVQLVGLFVNASAEEIQTVLDSVPLDVLQLHGDETLNNANKDCGTSANAVGIKPFR